MMKRVKAVLRLMYEIRPSKMLSGEVSTFAVRQIKKGEIIADVDSPEEVVVLKRSDLQKIDRITRKKIEGFCVQDEDGEYIVPVDLNNMGSSWYFNHSCDPNIAYDKKGNFSAARYIKKDEELFLDYGRMFTDPKFKMKCACGAGNCRGLVTGKDWLDSRFRRKNKDLMWPEMRKHPKTKG
jgi:SET domain-containing protein